jgi:hypothetical protein
MKRFAIIVVIAACSGSTKKPATTGNGSAALYAKKLSVGWGITQGETSADVFLQTTDETGAQTPYPLGTFPGKCKVITPAPQMQALTAVQCNQPATGVELDAVASAAGDAVIILKASTQNGVAPDPMSREELTRVSVPGGAKIEAGT